MKKLFLGMLLVAGLLAFSSVALPVSQNGQNGLHHKVTAQDIADIQAGKRKAFHNGKLVEARIVFHHRPGHSGGPGGGGGPGGKGDSTCFKTFGKGVEWKTTEDYVVDPTNSDGLSSSFVKNAIANDMGTWDGEVGFDIFGSEDTGSSVDGPDTVSPDDKNEIMFGSIGGSGTIAVTIVWGIFSGPPGQREIVEYDMVFDDPDYLWGDADVNPAAMDFENIATHELGHALGLDHPLDTCTEETMYAFAVEGETSKRDLNSGDIDGVNDVYA
jgi:hypothetical protein